MLKFKQYHKLLESAESSTLKAHLTHLEDLAVEEGKAGFNKFIEQVENFVNYIDGLRSKTSVNLKVDGAPALFFGIDPRKEYKDKFFIGTKTVFTESPNLIHSVEEIDIVYGDAPSGLKDIFGIFVLVKKFIYKSLPIFNYKIKLLRFIFNIAEVCIF